MGEEPPYVKVQFIFVAYFTYDGFKHLYQLSLQICTTELKSLDLEDFKD